LAVFGFTEGVTLGRLIISKEAFGVVFFAAKTYCWGFSTKDNNLRMGWIGGVRAKGEGTGFGRDP